MLPWMMALGDCGLGLFMFDACLSTFSIVFIFQFRSRSHRRLYIINLSQNEYAMVLGIWVSITDAHMPLGCVRHLP